MGRPPIGKVAMTGAERIRRYREKHGKPKRETKSAEIARLKTELEAIRTKDAARLVRPKRARASSLLLPAPRGLRDATGGRMIVRPCTLREANDFVEQHHRHNTRTARDGGKFAVAAIVDCEVVGVAIVGNPLSATFMEIEAYGYTAEVLRTCTSPDAPKGAVSFLYGACGRICREMGFDRLITYTLTDESGASLRGAGWHRVADTKPVGPGWRKKDQLQTRVYQHVMGRPKYRWEICFRRKRHRGPLPSGEGDGQASVRP